ncbi:hypothetical protein DERP_010498 [Dermatophagoides pteronyssinus]|uniref:Uncharacterized protein n=1 Tax=Dermatophagoides pteronyssinus TaxID=6956 RepID=A0ABQ8JGA9_DERPT|nr:hypothetical protein DERP_010498 [Dermatophagoides pteronyssinus]
MKHFSFQIKINSIQVFLWNVLYKQQKTWQIIVVEQRDNSHNGIFHIYECCHEKKYDQANKNNRKNNEIGNKLLFHHHYDHA